MAILFTCDACGRRLKAGPTLGGKAVACGGCGARLVVPDPILDALTLPPPGPAPVLGVDDDDGTPYGLEDPGPAADPFEDPFPMAQEPGPRPVAAARAHRSAYDPAIGDDDGTPYGLENPEPADDPPGAGASFSPASTFVPRTPSNPPRPGVVWQPSRSGPTPRGADPDHPSDLPEIRGWLAAAALLAAAGLGYVAYAFPQALGGVALLMVIVGGVVWVCGAWAIREMVLEESLVTLVLFMVFPFYQLYYLASRWREAMVPILLQFVGLALVCVGIELVKRAAMAP